MGVLPGVGGGGQVMMCRGMCTHGEVLLQRVSALLLQVGGGLAGWEGEAGQWFGPAMGTKSAHMDNETHRSHQHAAKQKTANSTMSHPGLYTVTTHRQASHVF